MMPGEKSNGNSSIIKRKKTLHSISTQSTLGMNNLCLNMVKLSFERSVVFFLLFFKNLS